MSFGSKKSNPKAQLVMCSPLMLLFSNDKSEVWYDLCLFYTAQSFVASQIHQRVEIVPIGVLDEVFPSTAMI